MITYEQASKQPASEKIALVTIDAIALAKIFSTDDNIEYYRVVPHFVVGVRDGNQELDNYDDFDIPPSSYFRYDIESKTLYIKFSDNSDPVSHNVSIRYRFFFSNAEVVLPWDLASGSEVEWENRIIDIGNTGQQLDTDNVGVLVETSSSVSLINNDGYFDDIFDTLIWENKNVSIYSWFPNIPITEIKKLFDGVTESKSFSPIQANFGLRDFVYKLKNKISMPLLGTVNDGKVLPSHLNKPKRLILGRAKNLKLASISCVLDGYDTPPLTLVSGSATVNVVGLGYDLRDYFAQNDELVIQQGNNNEDIKYTINSVSIGSITLQSNSQVSMTGAVLKCKPKNPNRLHNRNWSVSGDSLNLAYVMITGFSGGNIIYVESTKGIRAGDIITITGSGSFALVRSVGSNVIFTYQAMMPFIGGYIERPSIQSVYFKDKRLLFGRDYVEANFPAPVGCYLQISEMAEFNIAPIRNLGVNCSFSLGFDSMTTSADIDLKTLIKPRDWIRSNNNAKPDWYEVVEVREKEVFVRTSFIASHTGGIEFKSVDVIDDNSLVTADCYGNVLYDNELTIGHAARYLIDRQAGLSNLNISTFNAVNSDFDHDISLFFPDDLGGEMPSIRDALTRITETCKGSIYRDENLDICFSVLNARIPEEIELIQDDDILSWSVSTSQGIVNSVTVEYQPSYDHLGSGNAFVKSITANSDFVDNFIEIKNQENKKFYVYDDSSAEALGQRHLFYNSISSCVISVQGKMNFSRYHVGKKVIVDFSRMFKRFGSPAKNKRLMLVSGVSASESDVSITLTDLGGTLGRVGRIAPSDVSPYSLGSDDEKMRYGYILDNETYTPENNNENELGNSRIG